MKPLGNTTMKGWNYCLNISQIFRIISDWRGGGWGYSTWPFYPKILQSFVLGTDVRRRSVSVLILHLELDGSSRPWETSSVVLHAICYLVFETVPSWLEVCSGSLDCLRAAQRHNCSLITCTGLVIPLPTSRVTLANGCTSTCGKLSEDLGYATCIHETGSFLSQHKAFGGAGDQAKDLS